MSAKQRIAIVDDDASVRRALARYLLACSFEAESFGSGAEFLFSLPAFKPHCIVLDLHMEGMNGLQVQSRLTEMVCRIPVVVITGHDSASDREKSMKLGAGAFLLKPVNGHLLLATVRQLITACPDVSAWLPRRNAFQHPQP